MSDNATMVAHLNLARGYRGGERQTQLLIEGLADRGWRQKLIARRGEELAKRCRSIDALEIVEVDAKFAAPLWALGGSDIVHVHEAGGMPAAFLNRLLRGTPYVVTRRVQKGPRSTWWNRRMYGYASQVVSVSAAVADSLTELDSTLYCSLIPDAASCLPAESGRVAELRSEFGNGFVVGHIGALDDSHKGQRQLIELAREFAASDSEVQFVMVGSGRDAATLKDEAAGLPNVHFTGQVDDVGSYLAAFDAFIYPSRHEGLGSILLDALAFGLPVVATSVGGIPEVIETGVNGILCKPNDIKAMSKALRDLKSSDQLCQQMGQANRTAAENYLPERMMTRYQRLYERLLGVGAQERTAV